MVSASIRNHVSTEFYFASTTGDQICLASSEHFRKLQVASSEHFAIRGHSIPLAVIITVIIITVTIITYHTVNKAFFSFHFDVLMHIDLDYSFFSFFFLFKRKNVLFS